MSESPDPIFQALEDDAYDLLFRRGHSEESAFEALRRDAINDTLLEMAIASAHSLRHEQALRGELDWADWVRAVARDPGRSGTYVKILTAVTGLTTSILLFLIFGSLPAESRSRDGLIFASTAIGFVIFGLGSIPVYFLQHRKSQSNKDEGDGLSPNSVAGDGSWRESA